MPICPRVWLSRKTRWAECAEERETSSAGHVDVGGPFCPSDTLDLFRRAGCASSLSFYAAPTSFTSSPSALSLWELLISNFFVGLACCKSSENETAPQTPHRRRVNLVWWRRWVQSMALLDKRGGPLLSVLKIDRNNYSETHSARWLNLAAKRLTMKREGRAQSRFPNHLDGKESERLSNIGSSHCWGLFWERAWLWNFLLRQELCR